MAGSKVRTINDREHEERAELAPSGSSGVPTVFPGTGQSLGHSAMEVDSGHGGQQAIDWQFYFDTLSPYLSECLDDLATYLGISSDQLTSIRKDNNTEHEKCFHVLWKWLKQTDCKTDVKKLENLKKALTDAGRKVLADKDIPTRDDGEYCYKEDICDKQKTIQVGREVLTVAKGVGTDCARLGRYFKLPEEDIDRIVCNSKADSVNQGKAILEACIRNSLLKTRQNLCNGLKYIGNIGLIDDMNKYWEK